MNPKLTYSSAAVVLSILIFIVALLISSDLHDLKSFWLSVFGIIALINLLAYFLKYKN